MNNQETLDSQPVLDTLKELKLEVGSLRTELSRLEGSILKERVKAVEEALTQNRLLLYANQLGEEIDDDIEKLPDPECKNRLQCIERFKTIVVNNLELIKDFKTKEVITDLDSKIDNLDQTIERAKGTPCEVCHQKFKKKLKREKRAFQTIVLVEKTTENMQNEEELNTKRLVETILEPLANIARLKILVSTYEGKKSFSKLTQITSLRGGHLIFHLKKLLDAGLVAQEDHKGDYVITQRGIEAAKKIFLLQTQ